MKLEKKLKHALNSNNLDSIHQVFEEIYNNYNKLVYFVIMRYVKNSEDVRDLVQDTFLSFYNNLNHNIRNLKAYLTVTAKNKSLNYLRQKDKVIVNENFVYQLQDENLSNVQYQLLIEEMKNILSNLEIEIILQRTIYGLKFKEISQKLNIKLNTTISLYFRALK